jgi:uncharacterized membrane protein YhaH (DUF805 family)
MSQYVDFKGRARRKEYWMFNLVYIIILIVAVVIENMAGLNFTYTNPFADFVVVGFEKRWLSEEVLLPYGWVSTLVTLLHLLPGLGVLVRRLHDTGKSGWMALVSLIPIIGGIWLLVLMCTDSEGGDNAYGQNPKE